MVKDMLDESSFEASPAHAVPRGIGHTAGRIVERIAHDGHDEEG